LPRHVQVRFYFEFADGVLSAHGIVIPRQLGACLLRSPW
jgi:hypothetical protein